MKIIEVLEKNGTKHEVKVDDEDVPMLSSFHWTWKDGYAVTRQGRTVYQMHRLLMNVPLGERDTLVDHENNDHTDNQKHNLRVCDRFQNQQNRKTNKDNTLPKGISLLPSGHYRVRVQTYNSRISVGTFPTLEQAVEERNKYAQEHHKEFFNASYISESYDK